MRLVAGVLALTLFAPFARADDTTDPRNRSSVGRGRRRDSKVPLRVVRVMPESHQALLFDRTRAHPRAGRGRRQDRRLHGRGHRRRRGHARPRRHGRSCSPPPHAATARRDRDGATRTSGCTRRAQQPDTAAGRPGTGRPVRRCRRSASSRRRRRPQPGRDEAPSRTIEAGDGGVRVAQAPGSGPSATADAPAPTAHRRPRSDRRHPDRRSPRRSERRCEPRPTAPPTRRPRTTDSSHHRRSYRRPPHHRHSHHRRSYRRRSYPRPPHHRRPTRPCPLLNRMAIRIVEAPADAIAPGPQRARRSPPARRARASPHEPARTDARTRAPRHPSLALAAAPDKPTPTHARWPTS